MSTIESNHQHCVNGRRLLLDFFWWFANSSSNNNNTKKQSFYPIQVYSVQLEFPVWQEVWSRHPECSLSPWIWLPNWEPSSCANSIGHLESVCEWWIAGLLARIVFRLMDWVINEWWQTMWQPERVYSLCVCVCQVMPASSPQNL